MISGINKLVFYIFCNLVICSRYIVQQDSSYPSYIVYTVHGVHCTLRTLYMVYSVHCTLYIVYSVHSVQCTWCTLYMVYTVHGVHCTWCTLYTVHRIYGVKLKLRILSSVNKHRSLWCKHHLEVIPANKNLTLLITAHVLTVTQITTYLY